MVITHIKPNEPNQCTDNLVPLYTCNDGFDLLFKFKSEAWCTKEITCDTKYKLSVPNSAIIENRFDEVYVKYDSNIKVIEEVN